MNAPSIHTDGLSRRHGGVGMTRCMAPGCDNQTDRDICDHCDAWVDEQVAGILRTPTPIKKATPDA